MRQTGYMTGPSDTVPPEGRENPVRLQAVRDDHTRDRAAVTDDGAVTEPGTVIAHGALIEETQLMGASPVDGGPAGHGARFGDAAATEDQAEPDEDRDWAWVEEWRAGHEPVPWGPGLTVSAFTLILVASAVYVLSAGLADRPIVGIGVNVVVAAGLGPALWLSRGLPVLRWIAGGAITGLLVAWFCVFVFLA
jgi:hypothetical protein